MERIVLEVNSELAKAWRKLPMQLREQLGKDFEIRAAERIRKAKEGDFETALDQLRNKATDNGLTPEKLEAILNEED